MSCLFDSLAKCLQIDSTSLRYYIVKFLKTNPILLDDITAKDVIEWTDDIDLNSYTDKMLNTNEWGGAIEIKAFCELYNVNVKIHVQYTGKSFIITSSQKSNKTIHISYTGNHFEPLYITFN